VISQNPIGGTSVPTGSSVDIVVSTGQPDVPNVVGMTEGAATTAINAVANLSVGTVTYECSDTVAAGDVISQSPTAGAAPCDSTVDLVVSSGQPDVPDVVGMTEAAATTAINAVANLSVGTVTYECSDTVAAGDVISQSPTAGAAPCDSTVDLVVSSGQPDVPNVVGMTEAAATTAINAVANLSVGTVTYEYSDTVAAGDVISQNPAAGAAPCDSTVDLLVSTGTCSVTVPDVTGMAEATAIATINAVADISYGTSTYQCSDTVAAGLVIVYRTLSEMMKLRR